MKGLPPMVPLLLIRQGADQFLIARRIQQLGAGTTIRREKLSAEGLRNTANALLTDPTYRQQSARLGISLRAAGGASIAADALVAYKRTQGL
jgi:UDP:flavonoid glycosyltransferase YjiC (YdhE family)